MKVAKIWNDQTLLAVVACIGWFLLLPMSSMAQCNMNVQAQGFNALYGTCPQYPNQQPGFAMVDATLFGTDICVAINNIFTNATNPYNPSDSNGIVIDARGFTPPLTCQINPWPNNFLPSAYFSNVILLPAGTIVLSQPLVMPYNTKLVGAGSSLTILQAVNNFPTNPTPDMIDMGNSTICVGNTNVDCTGVAIEHLALSGNGQSLNGIVNTYSQELSYVNDVALTNFTGRTGLWLSTHSDNSGPYTNISYSGSGICAQIYDSSGGGTIKQTRGIHGLTCTMSGNSGAAVYVDAPNNSLEDLHISGGGAQDGIIVGSRSPAQNNVLLNVSGSGLNNVIHICGTAHSGNCGGVSVSDVTILGLTRSGGNNTIKDDLTQTTLTDVNLGLYIVGEPVMANSNPIGYSRFTSSKSTGAVTWLISAAPPSALTDPCAAGSLYSCTNGSSCPSSTLWGCNGSSGWKAIK